MKKRFGSILLLISLAVPVIAVYTHLRIQRTHIRREIKHRMMAGVGDNELVQIQLGSDEALSEINWEKDDEFEYNGEMYDVIRSDKTTDSVTYWCWWDHEETALNKRLRTLLAGAMQNDPDRKGKQKYLCDLYKAVFYSEQEKMWFPRSEEQLQLYYAQRYAGATCSPPSPPPDRV